MIKEKASQNEIALKKGKVWVDDAGICCVEMKLNVRLELEDIREVIAAQRELVTASRAPVMVDMSSVQSASREMREHVARADRGFEVSAVALITNSPLSRTMGNLFININRPKYPTRLFTDKAEAKAWLLTF